MAEPTLKLVILGGLDSIGKNMMALEYGQSIIVIDSGMMFPEDDMLGIDKVIPDLTYIRDNKDKIKALILTHGHEDHIGALDNFCMEVSVPVYGTKLTLALAEGKLKKSMYSPEQLKVVQAGDTINIDDFSIQFIRVSHSIPDGVALSITTPVGVIIHSGDFKVDHTPIDGKVMDLAEFARIGSEGVLLLLSDSTNACTEGFTLSERVVGETFDRIFRKSVNKRIIIVTFASNVHRIQQAIDASICHKRKVAVIGRSMEEVAAKAHEYGYLEYPSNTLIPLERIKDYPGNQVTIITTGSQGEPMSVLARMAREDYKGINLTTDDCVVLSADPIPGNEVYIHKIINNVSRKGAQIIYEENFEVHVSGHACQEELKLLINLVKPRFFIPIHGEYRHLTAHAKVAEGVGIPRKNIFMLENGDVLEFTPTNCILTGHVPGGSVLIDGFAEDEMYNAVQKDRKKLSKYGVVLLTFVLDRENLQMKSPVQIKTMGFEYRNESPVSHEIAEKAEQIITMHIKNNAPNIDRKLLEEYLINRLADYIYSLTKRRPVIVPIFIEI